MDQGAAKKLHLILQVAYKKNNSISIGLKIL